MRIEDGELVLSATDALLLGGVALLMLKTPEGDDVPCAPSHYFCQAAADIKMSDLFLLMGDMAKEAIVLHNEFRINAKFCPAADIEGGLSSYDIIDWVNAALDSTNIGAQMVGRVYELGILIGGEARLDA